MIETQNKLCVYRFLDEGIHEFVFLKSSRMAVDEWIQHMTAIGENGQPQSSLSLFDLRQSGPMPLSYFFQRTRAWMQTHPTPPGTRTRIAGLHDSNATIVSLVESFTKLVARDMDVAFFSKDERDQAIAWLLKKE